MHFSSPDDASTASHHGVALGSKLQDLLHGFPMTRVSMPEQGQVDGASVVFAGSVSRALEKESPAKLRGGVEMPFPNERDVVEIAESNIDAIAEALGLKAGALKDVESTTIFG